MKTTDLTIAQLFQSRPPFHVPTYQRSYAWEQDQLRDFTDDLDAAMSAKQGVTHYRHFFGGIVSVHAVASNVYGHEYEVIDGQQRLATFSMLFFQLKKQNDELAIHSEQQGDAKNKELAEARAKRISQQFLFYSDEVDGKPVLKQMLVLSKPDREFFERLINGEDPPMTRQSHRLLKQASEHIGTYIARLMASEPSLDAKLAKLESLLKTSSMDCHVVHLVTDTREEAYRLFEVLNDRGRSLSEGDLLRSHTLERLEGHPKLQSVVEVIWDGILGSKPSHIEKFLRAYYASYAGQRASTRQLFDQLKSTFFPSDADAKAIAEQVRNIKKDFQIYSALAEGSWPYDSPTVASWDRNRLALLINVLKNEISIPLLLAATTLPEKQFAAIVHLVEMIVFRYINMSRQHPSKLESVLLSSAHEIRGNSKYTSAKLRLSLEPLQAKYTPAEIFRQGLEAELSYKPKSGNTILKYVLATLEQFDDWFLKGAQGRPKCNDKSIVFDLSQLEVEHIYPRNAKSVDPVLEDLKHRLGNLSVWSGSDNGSAANQEFVAKKALYQKSKMALNRELAKLPKFGATEYETRRAQLLDRLVKIFTI